MDPLPGSDNRHLDAATGWLELGNHIEANEELEKITPALRTHPDVLKVRWAIYYLLKNWEACFDLASAMVKLAPDNPNGWRHRSASLHFMKRSQEAYDALSPAVARFPNDWLIHYDIACYACVLGHPDEARKWLKKTFSLGEDNACGSLDVGKPSQVQSIKQMALDDLDLERLWRCGG